MALATTELTMQRVQTKAFIDADPVVVVLVPRVRQRHPNGGWSWVNGSPRDEQTVSLIPLAVDSLTVTLDGVERKIAYEMMGEFDAQIAVGDTFTVDGDMHEVVSMYAPNGYSTRVLVSRHLDQPAMA
jgi:hypothetical protein